MGRRRHYSLCLACALPVVLATLSACAPQPLVPVDVAEAQCVRALLNQGSNTAVTIGVGAGGGGLGWGGYGWDDGWGGSGVAVSTTLPVATGGNPEADYNSCVLRRSGQMPDTPLAERPEIRG
jgi:hypothetical protein